MYGEVDGEVNDEVSDFKPGVVKAGETGCARDMLENSEPIEADGVSATV